MRMWVLNNGDIDSWINFIFVLEYNKKLSTNKFINDNKQYFNFLKEDDYEFLLKAKYGDKVDPEKLL